MISVLIPIYNYNAVTLIAFILEQLQNTDIQFEIICINDASTKFSFENNELKKFKNTQLINLDKNIGRSKIRNLLVEKSAYNWLLFLDADVLPKEPTFIKKYIECIQKSEDKVFVGGIVYSKNKPEKDNMLRWVYGKKREEISVEKRNYKPYQYVSGANFLINKSIFNHIKFNEKINKYGYEDVLFVEELKIKNFKITQINNPVYHLGLETNSIFLAKTKEGIENLLRLNSSQILKGENLKLLRTFKILKTLKITWFFAEGYNVFHKYFENNLLGKTPSLFLLDIYKLTYLCFINTKYKSI
ncbi:glycosyl transferase family 2 [Lutibacter oceani]|uniref:Glycosyl transferase family 2 n=1 Tax=Lutibacter oceani TaxID=1853311 RepID=A0A3D9RKT9_9FLAO|nr:glycosyltransferase [Lutibacter oceani]REE80490.1 glycosyl transferase family 2 [Lutibacter oceani]